MSDRKPRPKRREVAISYELSPKPKKGQNPYHAIVDQLLTLGGCGRNGDGVGTCEDTWTKYGVPSEKHRVELLRAIERGTVAIKLLKRRLLSGAAKGGAV